LEVITMTKAFKTALFVATAFALGGASLSASAQPSGPGSGGMMGDRWGWGMGWGMGGFGGIGLLVVVLLVAGLTFLAVRRRN
jgi:Spy/CpxP family protein refolding chaperone